MYILEMTDYSTVLNFTDFNLLNESHTFGKKNLGIIGPLANWSMKIQAYPEPNNGMIGYAMDEDGIELFQFQALRIVLFVLDRNVAAGTGLTTCLVLGAFQDHLYSVAFLCHDKIALDN